MSLVFSSTIIASVLNIANPAMSVNTETVIADEICSALKAESQEEKERNGRLLTQLGDMTDELRALRRKDEERELAYKKQLAAEQSKWEALSIAMARVLRPA